MNDINMFLKECNCKTIGITGNQKIEEIEKLIYKILNKAKIKTYLVRNFNDTNLTKKVNEIGQNDVVILELNEKDLINLQASPDIAIITDVINNNLNSHSEGYLEYEKNIFKYQSEDGILIMNNDENELKKIKCEANGKVIFFSDKEKLNDGYIADNGIVKVCTDGIRRHVLNINQIKEGEEKNLKTICIALAAINSFVNTDEAVKYFFDIPKKT